MTAYWRNLSAEMQLDSVSAPHSAPHNVHCLLSVVYKPSRGLPPGGEGGGARGLALVDGLAVMQLDQVSIPHS